MGDYGAAIDRARARVSAKASRILPDLCSFVGPPPDVEPGEEERDGDGYVVDGDEAIGGLSNVPCEYRALSVFERGIAGGTNQTATHRLKLPANANTLGISGTARGVIAARGLSRSLNFEVTGRLDGSTGVFLNLAIVLKG